MIFAILAVIGSIDTVRSHAPVQPGSGPDTTWHVPHLGLSWWLVILLGVALVGVMERSFRLHRDAAKTPFPGIHMHNVEFIDNVVGMHINQAPRIKPKDEAE